MSQICDYSPVSVKAYVNCSCSRQNCIKAYMNYVGAQLFILSGNLNLK